MNPIKKLVLLGLLTAQALTLFVIEIYIPLPIQLPGVKLGLANIVSLITLIIFGYQEAIVIVIFRTLLGSLFAGNFTVFFFSIAGGILSTTIMALTLVFFAQHFSLYTVSVLGAIFHNMGQLLVASIMIANFRIFIYLPPLFISAIATGYFIGLVTKYLLHILRKHKKILGLEAFRYKVE